MRMEATKRKRRRGEDRERRRQNEKETRRGLSGQVENKRRERLGKRKGE